MDPRFRGGDGLGGFLWDHQDCSNKIHGIVGNSCLTRLDASTLLIGRSLITPYSNTDGNIFPAQVSIDEVGV